MNGEREDVSARLRSASWNEADDPVSNRHE